MSILSRYLLRQNLWLMGLCLGLGATIYVLVDMLDHVDDFLSAHVPFQLVAFYFLGKLPGIMGQILPAVLQVAVLVQLGQMRSARELLALRAGGVPPWRLWRALLLLSLVWVVVQIGLSQVAGLAGDRMARGIWETQVQGKNRQNMVRNVWFRDGDTFGRVALAWPGENRGEGLELYVLSPDLHDLQTLVTAERFATDGRQLQLSGVREASFQSGEVNLTPQADRTMKMKLNLKLFAAGDATDLHMLPAWELLRLAGQLRHMGSNVEMIETAAHSRIAYAFALPVMVLVALAIASYERSMQLNVGIGMLISFGYFALFMLGSSTGEKGLLPPLLASWLANGMFASGAWLRLAWFSGLAKSGR